MNHTDFLPTFLGIGAQKAGTTWLESNLRKHPDIYMPPRKEIHYFDRSTSYPSPSFLSSDCLSSRIFGREPHQQVWREDLKRCLKKNICRPNWQQACWDFNYYFSRYDDDWYASLFKTGKGKVRGEITPSYSILEPIDIERIHHLMPTTKILYIIRNPIDRDWSAGRYAMTKKGKKLDDCSTNDFLQVLEEHHHRIRGDYVRTITNWKAHFPDDQLFIGFFEDIIQHPKQFLLSVFRFLGVETSEKYVTSSSSEKFNVSPQKDIPPEVKVFLTNRHYQQIQTLSTMVGRRVEEWLTDADSTLCAGEYSGNR